jgi:SNF2 family DNA or RNA helicase
VELIEQEALRLTVRSDYVPYITNYLEKSEVLKNNGKTADIVVHWGIKEMQHIAKFYSELKLPSPMLKEYAWPGLFTPFDHQKTTSAFLSLRDRAFCFNEAGTGKTSSVIWAADYLMTKGLVKRVLVVCPLSIMYSAWQADIFKTAMHRTVAVAYGDVNKRRKILNGSYEFVIINYDGVGIVSDVICKLGFDLIVIDEANAYKTVTTKRWKTLAKLLMPSTKLWMLTGTPASQSPLDAYGLARLVAPGNVPKYFTAWRDKVMHQITRFKYVPRPHAKQEVFNAVNAAAKLTKLLQISGGAVYTDTHEVVEFDVSPRLNALTEVLDETEHKVIIFVPYRHTIELVAKYLNEQGVSNEIINGQVAAKERGNIINRFQTNEFPRVLIIQPQAASHGVTLTAADTVVFWSPVMSVETYLQCVARIDRVGQVNKMTIVHLQGSEIERKMYQMLQSKIDSHEKLVDLYKEELGIKDE